MKPRRQIDVRITIVLALAFAAQGVGSSVETPAQSRLPVSISRIRQALANPTWLKIAAPLEQPTYHVEIREHRFFTEKPYTWNFGSGRASAPRNPGQPATPSFTPLVVMDVWHSKTP